MLDTQTKRRIDTARDILVGKVPDPKSQVEQITIALIYKFMDDMDAEAEELGGKRKFFSGDHAKYGWAKIMRGGLGGHEMLGLYAEGITKMPENPGVPKLFRDIFKNAFLPYRDPETLKQFLKIIDEFHYDHSERLGDAFEYLLSVLGSQGDAGQFRTPRHVIDFIVDVIAPKKGERILDPACGTAGFLISAYKHIANANRDKHGASKLTPDEREALARNVRGYDISPDMVRLSLANLYLHGFTDPQVLEYDSLTSEERWDETYDVILANPPFMSPKGGIKPHKRFSIQAKRSEVLFVDYIHEHLSPTGRAGIIVPEGIIFQSQTAYKALRKMLVEQSLVAVISLPAGCFNPYSGVKTSILILDKSLARHSKTVAFFKIENDGFGLGAQRRAIEKNDLPQVQTELTAYLQALRVNAPTETIFVSVSSAQIVAKEKIAANGDYSLSGERYREGDASHSAYQQASLDQVCEINPESVNPSELYPDSHFNYIDISCVENGSGKFLGANRTKTSEAPSRARRAVQRNDVLLSTVRPNLRAFALLAEVPERAIASTGFAVLRANPDQLLPGFLIAMLRDNRSVQQMIGMAGKGAYPSINQSDVEALQIPLPPLELQKEIVAEIEGYQKVIDGARAVIDNYRPHIAIQPDWPMVELGAITKPEYGFTEKAAEQGDARFVRITDISNDGKLKAEDQKFIALTEVARESLLSIGDILVARTGATFGKTMIFEESYPAVFASFLIRLRFPKERLHPRYYWVFAQSDLYWNQAKALMTGGGQPQFNGNALVQVKIPLPPLATQQAIVAEIETEQALVNANRELITRFEKKIQATLARVWGEDDGATQSDANDAADMSATTKSSKDGQFDGKTAESDRQKATLSAAD
jgi:type I restriction enzyme M protein